jgi:hypothetical protein
MGDRETEFLIDCRQTEMQSKKLGFSKYHDFGAVPAVAVVVMKLTERKPNKPYPRRMIALASPQPSRPRRQVNRRNET